MVTKNQTSLAETQNTAPTVNFGTWEVHVDDSLFEHRPYDSRPAVTIEPEVLVFSDESRTVIDAKKTTKKVKEALKARKFSTESSEIRWHTGYGLKHLFGSSKPAKELITFIAEHLSDA